MVRAFTLYVCRYMRRSFHAVRVARDAEARALDDRPTIIYLNHPSWWDPLFSIVLARQFFKDPLHYAPMEAGALRRYSFFRKLGFFGVEPGSRREAAAFLRIADSILSRRNATLWITPQGRFVDPRVRPIEFRPGLARLVARTSSCAVLPIALEYPFREERFPEALAGMGAAILKDKETGTGAEEWNALLRRRLEEAQDALAADSLNRNVGALKTVLTGRAGVGGVYYRWLWMKARISGKGFHREHGAERE